MYAEKHILHNRYTPWLKWASAAVALWQLAALLGAETGLPWLPMGYSAHLLLLICSAGILVLLSNAGLDLRVSSKGWAFRSLPAQCFYQYIHWADIRNVRILKPCTLPENAQLGRSERNLGQRYLISNPQYDVVCIELTSGFQVFVSVQKPGELIAFLHHELLQPDLKLKVLD